MTKTTVKLSPDADQTMRRLPHPMRDHFRGVIETEAQRSHVQPIVTRQTHEGPHIVRVIKDYRFPPGWRIIFRHLSFFEILVEKIAARNCDPYGDGK